LIENKTTLGERAFLTQKPAFWVGAVIGGFVLIIHENALITSPKDKF
jgi:hypothetical protein